MNAPFQDLDRRRPVWLALSDLFLDTEVSEAFYKYIAETIVASAYTPAEVHAILWDEVFPVIEWNLRHPCGVWEGFHAEYLEQRILTATDRQLPRATALGRVPTAPVDLG
jgi:hypothetical protein